MYGNSSQSGSLDNTFIKSIKDSSGIEITDTSNARGGFGNDSYLTFTAAETGKYYIETTSLYGDEGSFRLKVKEESSNLGGVTASSGGSHTIMVYMAGDNNLEKYMLEDLIEMQLGTLPTDWNVTFLIDRSEGYDTSFGDWADTRQGIVKFADASNMDEAN